MELHLDLAIINPQAGIRDWYKHALASGQGSYGTYEYTPSKMNQK